MNAGTSAKSGRMTARSCRMSAKPTGTSGTRTAGTRMTQLPLPESDGHLRRVGRQVRCIACDEPATRVSPPDHTEDYWFCPSCYAVGSSSRRT